MTYEQALDRLRNHSNLASHVPAGESLLHVLSPYSASNDIAALHRLTSDVIACLHEINQEINGPDLEATKAERDTARLVEVAYPVAGIISGMLLEYRNRKSRDPSFREQEGELLTSAAKIAFAWDQVLAGDIADLLEGFD